MSDMGPTPCKYSKQKNARSRNFMKPAAQLRQGSSMKCRPHYKKDGYA